MSNVEPSLVQANSNLSQEVLDLEAGILMFGEVVIPRLEIEKYGKLHVTITHFDNNLEAYVGRIDIDKSMPTEYLLSLVNEINEAVKSIGAPEHIVFVTITRDFQIALRIGKVDTEA